MTRMIGMTAMGPHDHRLRIAISGTYSTGKTTTTEALSRWLGIPRTHARSMREILPEAIPGKALEDCGPAELFQLGLLRFTERAVRESAMQGSFVSDGSSLHEWVYGQARMQVGINPNDRVIVRKLKRLLTLPYRPLLIKINAAFGAVVKRHAKLHYDEFIHLPVEFPLVKDGHRPVSEDFRALSDRLLRETLEELGIQYHVVSGTLEQRLNTIAEIYGWKPAMPLEQAITEATERVRALHLEIESDAQAAAKRRQESPWFSRLRQRLAA
jgi:nicotinamide riboside kinase